MGYIGNPLDPWGAADPATAYGAAFEAMAASDAYDVLVLVHDFPYRSLPSEVATANEVTGALLAATAERSAILPVYVSLTSGEPPPETKALLDGTGHGAPLLRGATEAFRAIAEVADWEARHAARTEGGPWRTGWPALAADRTSYGTDPSAGRAAPRASIALSERESLAFLAAAGIAVTEAVAVSDAPTAVAAARRMGHAVALKLDAVGLVHKTELGGIALGLRGDDAVYSAALGLLETGRRHGLAVRGLLVEPMAPHGLELILGLRRDPQFGPAVVVGLGGTLTEVLDDVAIRLAPIDATAADAMLDDLRGARLLRGVRGRAPVDRAAVVTMLVALGQLGARPAGRPRGRSQPGHRDGRRRARGRRLGRPGGTPTMTADEPVLLTARTPWGVRLTLNRPAKLNALSGDLVRALTDAIDAAEADRDVRVIVIEGAGRAFSAGYDLTEEAEGGIGGPVQWRELLAADVAATLHVLDCSKPVIAQVHGYALAGGLELAMACDLIVAAEGTKLGEPEIRYGSAPVTLLMPYLIGQKKTRELLLTGDLIDAVEAERIGLDQPRRPSRPARGRGRRARRPPGPNPARGDGPDEANAQPGDGHGRVQAGGRGRARSRSDHQRRRHPRAARVGRDRPARWPQGGTRLARQALRRASRRGAAARLRWSRKGPR